MILELKGIYKDYIQGKMTVPVLKDVNFSMEEGEYVAIMGPSGSGKTTLMNIIGCLDQATKGSFFLDGQDIRSCSENAMSDIRLNKIGFVFQSFNLISRLDRFVRIAQMMGECTDGLSERAAAELAISAIKTLSKDVGIPTTITELAARYVKAIDPRDIPAMVGHAQKDTCAATNPRTMSLEIISQLYKDVF